MRVLFLTQTTELGASSRYRVYQYIELLKKDGVICHVSPAVPDFIFNFMYIKQGLWRKVPCLFFIILRRFFDLLRVKFYDIIFIQREILPQVYPVFERLICLLNKNIVFDFDDAIFLVPPQRQSFLYNFRYKDNIRDIIRISRLVIVGNNYLKTYALRFNSNVQLIPTSIDTNRWFIDKKEQLAKTKVVIGWIGSEHTLFYLDALGDSLRNLSRLFQIEVRVVGVNNFFVKGVDVVNIPWSFISEVDEVNKFDIGIAPLVEDAWGKGKCALKALQYMSCGIPVVCSQAGVYKEIIDDGENGFLASDEYAWEKKLAMLISDEKLRVKIGKQGRITVLERFSRNGSYVILKSLFKNK
ncbi:MAG: glycosyltransferase family 4 protein [Candidatus Omnitrophica bacterium]|nr:glycosyltransferase family 4 protein [Candidatus Omnitrophota bacterium]